MHLKCIKKVHVYCTGFLFCASVEVLCVCGGGGGGGGGGGEGIFVSVFIIFYT